jgi:hypothetical protein
MNTAVRHAARHRLRVGATGPSHPRTRCAPVRHRGTARGSNVYVHFRNWRHLADIDLTKVCFRGAEGKYGERRPVSADRHP